MNIMLKKLVCIMVIGLLAVGFFGGITHAQKSMPPVIKKSQNPTTKYSLHAPIRINNDTEFTTEFVNRTIGALEINGTGFGSCIYIGNCTLSFVVEDCYLHNVSGSNYAYSWFWGSGLSLYNSSNGKLLNNNYRGNLVDIELYDSGNNTLAGNDCRNGIYLNRSNNNVLTNNDCIGSSHDGIVMYRSNSNTLTDNTCNGHSGYGITFGYSNSNNLTGNSCSGNDIGIGPGISDRNTLTGNDCSGNSKYGIEVRASNTNVITNNTCNGLSNEGIRVVYSNANTVEGNNCSGDIIGIWMDTSDGNTLSNNNCKMAGIYLNYSNNNILTSNDCSRSSSLAGIGIYLWFSNTNTFISNNCSRNGVGICLEDSSSNTFTKNTLQGDLRYGVNITQNSTENRIYLNTFIDDNAGGKQANDEIGTNFWNASGTPHGYGNYWSDWTFPDSNGDGIVDSPYIVDGKAGAKDYYPLTTPGTMPPEKNGDNTTMLILFLDFVIIIVIVAIAIYFWRKRKPVSIESNQLSSNKPPKPQL